MITLIASILGGVVVVGTVIIFMMYDSADYYDYKLRDMNAGLTLPERPDVFTRFVNMLRRMSSYLYYKETGQIK